MVTGDARRERARGGRRAQVDRQAAAWHRPSCHRLIFQLDRDRVGSYPAVMVCDAVMKTSWLAAGGTTVSCCVAEVKAAGRRRERRRSGLVSV